MITPTRSLLHEISIVGVGRTEMARRLEMSTLSACLEAAKHALADAGLRVQDVDGISARWPGPGGTVFLPSSSDWSKLLGVPLRWVGDTYPQGVPAALEAAAAIVTGQCETVLVVGGQADTLGGGSVASYTRPDNEFISCWGSITQAQFALVAQVYFARYRPDRTRLAELAATIRNAGSKNPGAVMRDRGPYTAEDVLASPIIASPFHLLEVCLATEGAAAMVLTSRERARDLPQTPVQILGGASEWYRQQYVDPPRFDEVGRIGHDAGRRTFAMAGITPSDVDVLELYDINIFEVPRQLEALGFCGEGEGTDFAVQEGISEDGRLPINTDGGLLSFAHIGWGAPTLKIIEAVQQLRGQALSGQVAGAQTALVTGAGSGAQYHNVLLLGLDD
jgi:acetyl-CoA acetyltransferase